MAKQKTQARGLFDPPEEQSEQSSSQTEQQKAPVAAKIKDACDRCGGKSLKTTRPFDHEGHTHYCVSGCMSEDRYDAYYFTPAKEEGAPPF